MSITIILIILTAIISFVAFSNALLMDKLIFSPTEVSQNNQYYRLVTSGFLHADVPHLLINMFVLWSFGTYVEQYLQINTQNGTVWYLLLYFGGIVVSSLPTYFNQKNNPNYRSLGASGAVEAVVFASILISPMTDICLYGILCLPAVLMGVAFLGYEYYMNTRRTDNINHSAHFTGALFGFVFVACIIPSLLPNFYNQIMAWF